MVEFNSVEEIARSPLLTDEEWLNRAGKWKQEIFDEYFRILENCKCIEKRAFYQVIQKKKDILMKMTNKKCGAIFRRAD